MADLVDRTLLFKTANGGVERFNLDAIVGDNGVQFNEEEGRRRLSKRKRTHWEKADGWEEDMFNV